MPTFDPPRIRSEFPITQSCVYLDSAYRGPYPARSAQAMQDFIRRHSEQPFPDGRQAEYISWVDEVRAKVALLLGVSPEEIYFPRSTTDAIGSVAAALLKPGDEVLVGGLDHPSDYTVWSHLAARGIRVTVVPHRDGSVQAEDLEAAIGPGTRALGLCLVNTFNGYREDIDRLGELAASRGLYLLLDAIQGMGHLNIDLGSGNVTLLAAGAYKWLCSPEGLGVAYLNRDVIEGAIPPTVHFYGFEPAGGEWRGFISGMFERGFDNAGPRALTGTEIRYPDSARRFEPAINPVSLTGLEQMTGLLTEIGGMSAVERLVLGISGRLRASLQENGHAVLSDPDPRYWSGIASVRVRDSAACAAFLRDRGVHVLPQLATARGAQALRVSTHVFNNDDDIVALTEGLNEFRDRPSG